MFIFILKKLQIKLGIVKTKFIFASFLLSSASLSMLNLWNTCSSSVKYSFVYSGDTDGNYHKAFSVSQSYSIQQLLLWDKRETREKSELMGNKEGIGAILTWQVRLTYPVLIYLGSCINWEIWRLELVLIYRWNRLK